MPRDGGPPMTFDVRLQIFWYLRWYDPTEDRCCAYGCRRIMTEDEVPLIMFRGEGEDCQQTRLHFECAVRLGLLPR